MYNTPADLLVRGLALPPLPQEPQTVLAGTCCAITGQPITAGYPVADMVTGATAEFLDCFRGGVDGWVSEAAARCFKSADPRSGNPCARSHLVFADGTYYGPLISRESAQVQGRACWSDLVRGIWPARQGEQCLIVLTTDTKKRLWIRARVGALGSRTPVLVYDAGMALDQVRLLDWPALLDCLDLVEEVYSGGFPKQAIIDSLYGLTKAIEQVGLAQTRAWERLLNVCRPRAEFAVAVLIAQKREREEDTPCQASLL